MFKSKKVTVASVTAIILIILTILVFVYLNDNSVILKVKQVGKGVEYTVNLNSDVKECGIVEDVYMAGELYSSRLVVYNDSVSADKNHTEHGSLDYLVHYAESGGFDGLDFIFKHNESVTSTSNIILPREIYTGCGSRPSFMTTQNSNKKQFRYKLTADDSFDLLTIALSTRTDGAIYANFDGKYAPNEQDLRNDTVVVYRFVTSSASLRE